MIDIHCHILPNIDDGAESLEQSLSILRIAKEEGIDTIVATHHYFTEERCEDYLARIHSQKVVLLSAMEEQDIDIRILTGAEVFISPELMGMERLKDLCIGDSRYMLIELPMGEMPLYTEEVIYHLRLKGIVPIIAHPERNLKIMGDANRMYRLVELGAMGQVNTGSIKGYFGSKVQKCARNLLECDMIHLLGTDAHSDRRRSPKFRESAALLEKWIGAEKADRIIHENPAAIIGDEIINIPSPIIYKKRSGLFTWFKE